MAKRRQVRSVGGAGNYVKFTDMQEGDWFVGKFIEEGFDSKYKKPKYTFEIEEAEFASAVCHNGKDIEEGMRLTLNSAGGLDHKMKEVNIGDVIEFRYEGKEELPEKHTFAGTKAHQFSIGVCVDEEEGAEAGEDSTDEEPDL